MKEAVKLVDKCMLLNVLLASGSSDILSTYDFLGFIIILITDLWSVFRSEDTEALDTVPGLREFEQMSFQFAFESENVFAQLNVSR